MTYPCSVYVMSMLILSCSKDLHPVLRKSHQTSEILRIFIIERHVCSVLDIFCSGFA